MVFFVLLPFDKLRVTTNLIFKVKVSVIVTLNLSEMTLIGFWKVDTSARLLRLSKLSFPKTSYLLFNKC